jgi:hypothetical protein
MMIVGAYGRVKTSRADAPSFWRESEADRFGSLARRLNAILGQKVGQPFAEHRDKPGGLRWIEVNGARATLAIPQTECEKLPLGVPGQTQSATPSVTKEHPRRRQSVELSHGVRPS